MDNSPNRNEKHSQSKIQIIYSDKTAEENREKYKNEYEKFKELHDNTHSTCNKTDKDKNTTDEESDTSAK
jgi:ribulose kinase